MTEQRANTPEMNVRSNEQRQRDWKYWIFGAATGAGVGGTIVGLIVKKICDRKLAQNAVKVPVVPKTEELCDRKVVKTVTYPDGSTENYNKYGVAISGTYKFGEKTVTDPAEEEHPTDDDPDIDPNDMDISIDDVDASAEMWPEADKLDKMYDITDRYLGKGVLKTRIIGPDDYAGDHHYEKSSVNWYEVDNVFEEELTAMEDPYDTLGVVHGNELFAAAENREDPDIVYVRNENCATDFEINRIHGSYEQIVGRERPLGEANS